MIDDIVPTGPTIEELQREGFLVDNTRRFWAIQGEQARAIANLSKDLPRSMGSATSPKVWPTHHAPLEPPKLRPVAVKPSNNPWYRKFAK